LFLGVSLLVRLSLRSKYRSLTRRVGLSLPTIAQGQSDGRQALQVLAELIVKKDFIPAVGFSLLSLTQGKENKKEKDSKGIEKKG